MPTTPCYPKSMRVNAGWITAWLKWPRGSSNPQGFDVEAAMLERNIRPTGYVRKANDNLRLDEMVTGLLTGLSACGRRFGNDLFRRYPIAHMPVFWLRWR
jgi:hypothetical protein